MAICSKRLNWFCVLCASYVYIKHRIKFNDVISRRFIRAYKELPANLGNPFVPQIICRTCYNDLQRHVSQYKPLRYERPAVWKIPEDDHSDCFMCRFTVHKYNRIAKRLFSYATKANLELPIANADFNDKLNNLQNIKKGKSEFGNAREEAIIRSLINDLIICVETEKEYKLRKIRATPKRQVFKNMNGTIITRELGLRDDRDKVNFLNQLNLIDQNEVECNNENDITNRQNNKKIEYVTRSQLNQINQNNINQAFEHDHTYTSPPKSKQSDKQSNSVNQGKRSLSQVIDDEDDDICIVGEVKRCKNYDGTINGMNSISCLNLQQISKPNSSSTANNAKQTVVKRVDKQEITKRLSVRSEQTSSNQESIRKQIAQRPQTAVRQGSNRRPIRQQASSRPNATIRHYEEIIHDIEIRHGEVSQVGNEDALSKQNNIFDLSSGSFPGTFRVEDGIELRTYFGKKFKQSRQVTKTSRNEFDDLVSMLDIDENSVRTLETFFERKNYFIW